MIPIMKKISLLSAFLFFANIIVAQIEIDYDVFSEDCICVTVQLYVSGGENPYTYQWSNGDTAASLFFCDLLTFREYTVTVTDATGLSAVATIIVQPPTGPATYPIYSNAADLCPANDSIVGGSNGGCEKVCPGTEVTYCVDQDFSFQGQWRITGTDNYEMDSLSTCISVVWDELGTGNVSFETWDECIYYEAICVEILEIPEANFSTNPASTNDMLTVCQGQVVEFINESENAFSYQWNFGLTTSEEENPTVTFAAPGTYEVLLTALNECLCSDTSSMTIVVTDAVTPVIDCVSTVCEGDAVSYTSDLACGNYNWTISPNGIISEGGGTNDDYVTIEWLSGPEGTIELEVSGCSGNTCTAPAVMTVPIITASAPIEGPDLVCKGSLQTYALPEYEGTEFIWTVTGGTIIGGQGTSELTVQWADYIPTNTASLSVVYENCYLECGGDALLDVAIRPEFYVQGPIEACENSTEVFSAINTESNLPIAGRWRLLMNSTEVWNSGGDVTDPSVAFDQGAGAYVLECSPSPAMDYCNPLFEVSVDVLPSPADPTGIIGETNVCPELEYSYEAQTATPTNNFRWEIIDGGTTVVKYGNPIVYQWGSSAPYALNVTAINSGSLPCESNPVNLDVEPIPSFVISGDNEVCFDQISTLAVPYYEGIDYVWTISPADAGTIINDPNSHTIDIVWHQTGMQQIQLDACGQSAAYNVEVFALPEPVVNAPSMDICPNETVNLTTTQAYNAYTWKNENGQVVSTASNPDLGPGYYQVVVENEYGCLGDTTFYIGAHEASIINISTPDDEFQCPGPPSATLYALDASGGYSYEWFRNGISMGLNDTPIITIADFGVYHVQIIDANGCTAESNTISIRDCTGIDISCPGGNCTLFNNNLDFNIIPGAACNQHSYESTSVGYDPGTISWHFNNPGSVDNTIDGENVSHVYTEAGFYKVVIYGEFGGNLAYNYQVDTVLMAAEYEYDNACAGEAVNFYDLSTFLPFVTITDWSWDFGDPASGTDNTSTSQDPSHTFSMPGTYTVTLTTTADSGCTSTVSKEVTVLPPPPVTFDEPTVSCAMSASEFVAQVGAEVTYVSWDFGDPASGNKNTSELFTAYHAYDAPGTYDVSIFVQSIYGCQNTFSRTITIEPNMLTGEISPAGTSTICEGGTLTLTASISGLTYLWSTNETTESIDVTEAGVYTVTLTNADGCSYVPEPAVVELIPQPDAIIRSAEFNNFGQPSGYHYEYYEACYGEDVFIETIDNVDYTFNWSGGEVGSLIEYTEANDKLLPVGTNEIYLTVTDNTTSCTNVIGPMIVEVHALPQEVIITSSNAGLVCEGTPTTFTISNPEVGVDYYWSNGVAGASMTTSAAGIYYATAVNEDGCSSESNQLEIVNGPDISLIPGGCHTRCNPDTLCLPSLPGVTSFQWYFNGTPIAGSEGMVEELIITESGSYWVEMENTMGCVLSSEPLNLDIYDGYGSMSGNVYADVDESGDISAADTLVSGVVITYESSEGETGSNDSDADGYYAFENIRSTNYVLNLEESSLPAHLAGTVIEIDTVMQGCDVEIEVNWLVIGNCEETTDMLQLQACDGEFVTYNGVNVYSDSTFTVVYQNVNGCDSTEMVQVNILDEIVINMTAMACFGENYNYQGTSIPAGQQMDFVYTSASGCDSTVTVQVFENTELLLSVDETETCPDINAGTAQLTTQGGDGIYAYSLDGVDFSANGDFTDLEAGSYTAYVQDGNGCLESMNFTIQSLPELNIYVDGLDDYSCEDLKANLGVQVLSGDDGNVQYLWEGGSILPNYVAASPGMYHLSVSNNCQAIDTMVRVEMPIDIGQSPFVLPSAFSPNEDGINDNFLPYMTQPLTSDDYHLAVFDRWGAIIYESDDMYQGWDGKLQSTNMKPGVYVWMIESKANICGKEKDVQMSGEVMLIR